MVRRFVISLVCLLLLSLAPLALAQDLDESISDNGFTYLYPSEWAYEDGMAGIVITNNEAMFAPDAAAQSIPADILRVQIAGREFVKYATAGVPSAKVAVVFFASFMMLPGDLSIGSFNHAEFARFEARDPSTGILHVVYGLDFGSALTLVSVAMGSDYEEEPPVIIDMITSITYAPPPRPSVSDSDTIAYGDEFVSELTEEADEQSLVFEGSAGDLVTISMNSEAFDPLLRLYSETSDEPLIVHDDVSTLAQGGTNAKIAYFPLPEDGRYVIVATTVHGIGEYTLTLQEGIIPVETRMSFENMSPSIAYGDTVTGALDRPNAEMFYIFEGSAGDVVTITMIAENEDELDTVLELYAARAFDTRDRVPLARDDDMPDSFNSQIANYVLPEDGKYLIITRGLHGEGEGEYTLTLERDGDTQP
jgi:hypothetical protein